MAHSSSVFAGAAHKPEGCSKAAAGKIELINCFLFICQTLIIKNTVFKNKVAAKVANLS